MPAETASLPACPSGRLAIVACEPAVEALGVGHGRLREDDGELVAADAAGDVGRADDVAEPLGRLGEHGVAGEVADPVVDRLEVVEVEHDQRQLALVAIRAGHLPAQGLVEVAAVVEPGQRVHVGELAGLAEARALSIAGPARLGELLELAQRRLAERIAAATCVGDQVAEILAVRAERHRERAWSAGSLSTRGR